MSRLSGYEILEELGRGAFGVVYRARQKSLNREVAVKLLNGSVAAMGSNVVRRFRRELESAGHVAHRGVARIFDAGEHEGQLYYAMELVRGTDLGKLRSERGPLSVELVSDVLEQLLDAVGCLHHHGLVHRDIKPSNIALEESSGRVVLLDFGLARCAEATLITAAGELIGTPRFMSPEQLRGQPATSASDLWSIGVTAYSLLAPEYPFGGRNIAELASAIDRASAPPLSEVRPDVPAPLGARISQLMTRDPAARAAAPRTGRRVKATPPDPSAAVKRVSSRSGRGFRLAGYSARATSLALAMALALALALAPRPAPVTPRFPESPQPVVAPASDPVSLVRRMLSEQGGADWSGAVGQRLWLRLASMAAKELGTASLTDGALRRGVSERPDMRVRVAAEILRWSASAYQQQLFAALKPHVAGMVGSDLTARDVRVALRELLWKLDQVDAVAEYLEQHAPFGVRRSLAGAVDVSAEVYVPANAGASAVRRGVRVYPSARQQQGQMIYVPGENPASGGPMVGLMSEAAMTHGEKWLAAYGQCDAVLLDMPAPGARGVRVHFLVKSLHKQSALHIVGPGGSIDLKLRRPAELEAELDTRIWLTVTLTGAPARARGPWSLRHIRAFQDSGRAYYLLDEVWAESLP